MAKRNLTLSIDEDLLDHARLAAVRRRQSLTALVRQFLETLAAQDREREDAACRLARRMARRPIAVRRITWSRSG